MDSLEIVLADLKMLKFAEVEKFQKNQESTFRSEKEQEQILTKICAYQDAIKLIETRIQLTKSRHRNLPNV